tara:strand:+ start:233 stop:1117 length:885 start_codon:yes stop_codon:yes gene_type:complete
MKKTLIIGSSGSLGKEILKKYENHERVLTYNDNAIKSGVKFDAVNMDLEKTIKELETFNNAILLLADKNPNSCYKNRKFSNKLNVLSIKKILSILKKYKIKPIFLSTDVVFSGNKGNYIESDKPDPILLYGKQKTTIENFIRENFKEYLIFRLSKTFSVNRKSSSEPFYNWLDFFEKENTIYCATDQIYNPISIEDAAEIIFQISKKNLNGIFNLAGPKSFSRYEIFEKLYNEYSKFRKKKIKLVECSFNQLNKNFERWPLNTSMIIDKTLQNININFLSVEDATKETIKNYFN